MSYYLKLSLIKTLVNRGKNRRCHTRSVTSAVDNRPKWKFLEPVFELRTKSIDTFSALLFVSIVIINQRSMSLLIVSSDAATHHNHHLNRSEKHLQTPLALFQCSPTRPHLVKCVLLGQTLYYYQKPGPECRVFLILINEWWGSLLSISATLTTRQVEGKRGIRTLNSEVRSSETWTEKINYLNWINQIFLLFQCWTVDRPRLQKNKRESNHSISSASGDVTLDMSHPSTPIRFVSECCCCCWA